MITHRSKLWWALLSIVWACCARAQGLDHELPFDQHGIWARSNQVALQNTVLGLELGGALLLGNNNDVGHTFWQTIDASAISGAMSELLKLTTGRARPDQGNDPNRWFAGSKYESFPSGEVTLQASFVTPFIVNYGRQQPLVLLLEALPLYDAEARLKSQAHWQTDVIAGWALGTGVGYWATTWKVPLFVRILPGGLSVGLYTEF